MASRGWLSIVVSVGITLDGDILHRHTPTDHIHQRVPSPTAHASSQPGSPWRQMAMQKSTAQLTSAISSPRRIRKIQSSPTREIRNF